MFLVNDIFKFFFSPVFRSSILVIFPDITVKAPFFSFAFNLKVVGELTPITFTTISCKEINQSLVKYFLNTN